MILVDNRWPDRACPAFLMRHGVLALAVCVLGAWVGFAAWSNTAPWGDHLEQFGWAHSIEWGYHKHPPLPTWLLAAAISLGGPAADWPYALAAACGCGTAVVTYLIARRLIGVQLAPLAILLWGLQQAFSLRAQLFNHNTVMIFAVGATALAALRATDDAELPGGGRRHWLLAGALAGLAMLAKYQSIVPLAGIATAVMLDRGHQSQAIRRGLLMSAGAALVVFGPHLAWMFQHDLSTVRYASQTGHVLPWSSRGLSMISFLAQQVRLLAPALVLVGGVWALSRARNRVRQRVNAAVEVESPRHRSARIWLFGLVIVPLAGTLVVCPVFGLKLQNHWGYQCLQFVSLWLAWRLRALPRPGAVSLALGAVAIHVTLMIFAFMPRDVGAQGDRRIDVRYPARSFAAAVHRDWRSVTSCPLKLVVGPSFEAGLVSVYTPGWPAVLEDGDFAHSPWIRKDDLSRRGAVHVAHDPAALDGLHAAARGSMEVEPGRLGHGRRIHWAIVPPDSCDQHTDSPVKDRPDAPIES